MTAPYPGPILLRCILSIRAYCNEERRRLFAVVGRFAERDATDPRQPGRVCRPGKGSASPGLRLLRLWGAPHDSLHPAEDRGARYLSQGLAGTLPDAELRGGRPGDPQWPALLGNGGLERQPVRPEPDALERGPRLGPVRRRDLADPCAEQPAQRAFGGARPAEHLQLRARGNPSAAAPACCRPPRPTCSRTSSPTCAARPRRAIRRSGSSRATPPAPRTTRNWR